MRGLGWVGGDEEGGDKWCAFYGRHQAAVKRKQAKQSLLLTQTDWILLHALQQFYECCMYILYVCGGRHLVVVAIYKPAGDSKKAARLCTRLYSLFRVTRSTHSTIISLFLSLSHYTELLYCLSFTYTYYIIYYIYNKCLSKWLKDTFEFKINIIQYL